MKRTNALFLILRRSCLPEDYRFAFRKVSDIMPGYVLERFVLLARVR